MGMPDYQQGNQAFFIGKIKANLPYKQKKRPFKR
jgi:hypothetical protein